MSAFEGPRQADVVIAGGGITGASSLYHLVSESDRNVLLLDARGVNFGSTARSAAAFRHQFSSEINVRMSLYSGRVYERFPETFGTDELLVKNGYLFLYRHENQFETAAKRVAFQRDLGVENVRVLEPDEIDSMFPHLNTNEIAGATWGPDDGFIRPERASREFINASFEHDNTALQQNCAITGVEVTDGVVTGVEVNGQHRVETNVLVNAAGVWCHQIAAAAGVTLPVEPVKRYLYFTNQFEDRDVTGFPLTVRELGPYFRPEHRGLMLGWDDQPAKPDAFDAYGRHPPDPERLYEAQDQIEPGYGLGVDGYGYRVLANWAEWVPFLQNAGLTDVSSGYYQVTPDSKAIVSGDPRVDGLFHAVGFSGHGVMHAPATGRAVADLVLDRSPPFELDALALAPLLRGERRSDPEDMVL